MAVLFFLCLSFAGITSLMSNLELMTKTFTDFGCKLNNFLKVSLESCPYIVHCLGPLVLFLKATRFKLCYLSMKFKTFFQMNRHIAKCVLNYCPKYLSITCHILQEFFFIPLIICKYFH
jgi:SNF family Na+-dependent transporter